MANELENFDELLKDVYEGAEVPFNEAHWKELESELNIVSPSVTGYFSAISTGIVATSLVFAIMLFIYSGGDGHINTIIEEDTITNTGGHGGTQLNTSESQSAVDIIDSSNNKLASETESNSSKPQENINNSLSDNSVLSENEKVATEKNASIQANNKSNTTSTKGDNNSENDNVVVSNTEVEEVKNNIRKGCTGLTIAFDASEEYGTNARYLWNFGDGYFSNEANPSHTFNKEGIFDVSLSVTSSASGQITSNVVQAMIEIEEAPVANIDLLISGPNTITFNNKSFNASDVEWNLDGTIEGNGSSISLSVADNTNYDLQLSAINEGGCVDTLLTTIRTVKAGSEFPRAMDPSYGTPFAPGAILDEGEVTSVKIFDRKNGALVFEGSGNKGWNGKLPSGEKADQGNYRWVMAVKQQNAVDVYHGNIDLR